MEILGTPVIVLGMARSGTSYLTSFLAATGVDLGGKLIPTSGANPRGFFEDSEILEFHRKLLRRFRPGPNFDENDLELVAAAELTGEETGQAREILRRLSRPGVWGWKEPRTIHFVDFWLQELPQARILIPLRHPLDLAYSYLKRVLTIDRIVDIQRIFRAYAEQTRRIVEIMDARPGRCLAVYTPNAFANPAALAERIAQFLNLPDRAGIQAPQFESSEFTQLSIDLAAAEIFSILLPEAAAAFEALNARADFPFRATASADAAHDALRQLAQAMKASGQRLTPENWLPLLFDLCQPEKGYFALQGEWLTGYAKKTRYLERQLGNFAEELRSHTAVIEAQRAWIAQLEEAKRFLIEQLESYQKALGSKLNEPQESTPEMQSSDE